ncbi:hypothetical protein K3U93_03900 [Mycobacterium malmoense]|uniref:PE-PGRS family protein n=1 Tax=Mycobacterium malmoense TaxID=1780 RepID=A0ABX3SZ63_MYCMA|nr:hypothetical protein [Mycobacterium malmoense]ORA85042.1 hypothetical protein BST29_02275 [Mycobacterium malmoense]QZA18361.1 hypothetical protein K3U93_03900 [Mycobacterium malmoense]UNB95131.1 hypothetical protein H5T25_03890 [Mycobacterium malmoense]
MKRKQHTMKHDRRSPTPTTRRRSSAVGPGAAAAFSAAARPIISAGVVMAGAGMIALTPATLPRPHFEVPNIQVPAINLTAAEDLAAAAFDPTFGWESVFEQTSTNLSTLSQEWLAAPAPLLQQVITNQLGYANMYGLAFNDVAKGLYNFITGDGVGNLQWSVAMAAKDLFAGNLSGVFSQLSSIYFSGALSVLEPLESLLPIPVEETQNLANLADAAFGSIGSPVASLALQLVELPQGLFAVVGDSAQGVLNGITGGNPLEALTAVLDTPANLVNALLNLYPGVYGEGTFDGILQPGHIASLLLLTLPQTLATSIGWEGPSGSAAAAGLAVPDLAAALGAGPFSDAAVALSGLSGELPAALAGLGAGLASALPAGLAGLGVDLGMILTALIP